MITANELKTKGVSSLKTHLQSKDAVGITVRGKVKYMAMTIEEFERLREIELDMAIIEVKNEVKKGIYTSSLEDHFKELESNSIAAEDAGDYNK